MTKHTETGSESGDRPALEIEITPQMIEAGVRFCRETYQWGEHHLDAVGPDEVRDIVYAVLGSPKSVLKAN